MCTGAAPLTSRKPLASMVPVIASAFKVSEPVAIDANVLRDVSGATPVHISGRWACGAPLALASFDASVPCGAFYALNQLHDADIARMKAGACNNESLAFKGDLSGQLDHAITDTGASQHSGIDADTICGAVGAYFAGAFKFSIGDESFLLDLNLHTYPAVAPGEYSAA